MNLGDVIGILFMIGLGIIVAIMYDELPWFEEKKKKKDDPIVPKWF